MSKIKTPALSLRELLVQIKDLAEIQLDLAYSAVIYDDREAAEQALRLESKITEYLGYVIIRAVMAGRDIDLAEKMYALILFASALEEISDAAADIAKLTVENVSLGVFKGVLMHADEVTIRIEVGREDWSGATIDQIEQQTGMRVVAVRRAKHWILNPPGDFKVWRGDVLYLTGPEEKIDDAYILLTGKKHSEVRSGVAIAEHLRNFFDVLISLKYMAETSLALSYYALLTEDIRLAEEVEHLEQWVDYMREVLYLYTLRLSRHFNEVDALRGFFTIIDATERITDSAYKLAQIVKKGIDVSSFFKIIFDVADEKIISFEIKDSSKLVGMCLEELNIEEKFGVFLLGIRRGMTWYFSLEDKMQLEAGDVLILRGPAAAIHKFIEAFS